jgi:hypothetical protein
MSGNTYLVKANKEEELIKHYILKWIGSSITNSKRTVDPASTGTHFFFVHKVDPVIINKLI